MSARSSLVRFHRVLITAGILFCGGFAVWCFASATSTGRALYWALGVAFTFLGLALAIYLGNLRRVLGYRDEQSSRP